MEGTRQQISGAPATVSDQLHNGRQLVAVDVDDQARWLTKVEQNMDTMIVMMERVDAMMMHMAQNQ